MLALKMFFSLDKHPFISHMCEYMLGSAYVAGNSDAGHNMKMQSQIFMLQMLLKAGVRLATEKCCLGRGIAYAEALPWEP